MVNADPWRIFSKIAKHKVLIKVHLGKITHNQTRTNKTINQTKQINKTHHHYKKTKSTTKTKTTNC